MVDPAIATSARRYFQALNEHGINVAFGVLFGSQAIGKSDSWSDIDLLVISSRLDRQHSRNDGYRLWRLTAKAASRIEPITDGERQ